MDFEIIHGSEADRHLDIPVPHPSLTISEIPAIKTKYLETPMDSESSRETASVNIQLCYVIFHNNEYNKFL